MAICFLTPIYTSSEKRLLISDHIKGPLVAAFRSLLMKVINRSVETLGLWIVTSPTTFIKSVNRLTSNHSKQCCYYNITWWFINRPILVDSASVEQAEFYVFFLFPSFFFPSLFHVFSSSSCSSSTWMILVSNISFSVFVSLSFLSKPG